MTSVTYVQKKRSPQTTNRAYDATWLCERKHARVLLSPSVLLEPTRRELDPRQLQVAGARRCVTAPRVPALAQWASAARRYECFTRERR